MFSLRDMMDAIEMNFDYSDGPVNIENIGLNEEHQSWIVNYGRGRVLHLVEPGNEIDATDLGVLGITKVYRECDVIHRVIDYMTGPEYISPLTPGYFKRLRV